MAWVRPAPHIDQHVVEDRWGRFSTLDTLTNRILREPGDKEFREKSPEKVKQKDANPLSRLYSSHPPVPCQCRSDLVLVRFAISEQNQVNNGSVIKHVTFISARWRLTASSLAFWDARNFFR